MEEVMSYSDLILTISPSVEDCIEFCKGKGLLRKKLFCKKCVREECKWRIRSKNIDSYAWRCPVCNAYFSIRTGSFFERSKLELKQILKFVYLWSFEMASYCNIERECRITSRHTVTDWENFIRDVCCEHFFNNSRLIGGPGHTVEIGETEFNRRKYNVGRSTVPLWVFGGYDPTDKVGFLVAVPNRKAETLLPIIKQYILPGTTIISDGWKKAYSNLEEEGFQHVEISYKKECGTHRDLLLYLQEFMWRQKFGQKDPFNNILSQISDMYPFFEDVKQEPSSPFFEDVKQEPSPFFEDVKQEPSPLFEDVKQEPSPLFEDVKQEPSSPFFEDVKQEPSSPSATPLPSTSLPSIL